MMKWKKEEIEKVEFMKKNEEGKIEFMLKSEKKIENWCKKPKRIFI